MINISEKKECSGCCACLDSCPTKAISLVTDDEGFWYPKVDEKACINCGRCVDVCPELQVGSLSLPEDEKLCCFSVQHKELAVRMDSTSGGAFTAFATAVYNAGGAVAGAVYNDDFSVRHIVSEKPEDLDRLRSSKYLQSDCSGMYLEIKKRLASGQQVFACGCPCQMAALRLFLGEDPENLIVCDFVCRGINSPMVFRTHLDDLERTHNSPLVLVKAKNKEHGWRSLTFKATFKNGSTYYGDGRIDNFTRGYLQAASYCRPSCFECKYKGMPRRADLSIGDFWGVEKVTPHLDDNTGSSFVLCNTDKGRAFFESVKEALNWEEIELDDIVGGNRSIYESLPEEVVPRNVFFNTLRKMSFKTVAKKYFPRPYLYRTKKKLAEMRRFARGILRVVRPMLSSPQAWWQFVFVNFLRKNTKSSLRKLHLFVPTRCCVLDIHPDAKIELNGIFLFGGSRVRRSRLESRILLEKGTEFKVGGDFYAFAGADVQVFTGGRLTLLGGPDSGMNIHTQIVCKESVTIGRSTLIGRNNVIRDYDAHYILQKGYKISAPVKIGDHCWLGDGAYIGKGVCVGTGSIVAARSWVITKVPERVLVAGTPAMPMDKNIRWKV